MTVRRCFGGEVEPKRAVCPAAIVDDDLLSENFAELERDVASRDVSRSTRRKRYDHAHGFDWKSLCCNTACNTCERYCDRHDYGTLRNCRHVLSSGKKAALRIHDGQSAFAPAIRTISANF